MPNEGQAPSDREIHTGTHADLEMCKVQPGRPMGRKRLAPTEESVLKFFLPGMRRPNLISNCEKSFSRRKKLILSPVITAFQLTKPSTIQRFI